MKKILVVTILLLINSLASEEFLKGLEDIPLYKSMTHVENSLVMFDKINGRFVSTEITGPYKYEEVSNFYNKILPNLGWKITNNNLFERGTESLRLEFKTTKKKLTVVFSIFPKKSE